MEKEKYIKRECKHHGLTTYRYVNSSKKYRCVKCLSEAVQKRRDKTKQILVEYKGGKCEICGYNKCIQALEFHHIDPNQKDFGIGAKGYTKSIEKNKEEVDKCILVCSNCHREIHDELNKNKIRNEFLNTEYYPLLETKQKKIINKTTVKELIKSGYKQNDIANKIGVSLATLKRFLKSNNMNKKNNYLID